MAYNKLFFDLQKELTTNPAFATRAERQVALVMKAAKEDNKEAAGHEMAKLLRLCDFNPTLLVPYMFPHFPEQDPMSLLSRPHAVSMMALVPNGSLTVQASRQVGKCLSGLTFLKIRTKTVENKTISEVFEAAKQKNLVKTKQTY